MLHPVRGLGVVGMTHRNAMRFAGYTERTYLEHLPSKDGEPAYFTKVTAVTTDSGLTFKLRQYSRSPIAAEQVLEKKGPLTLYLPGLGFSCDGGDPFIVNGIDNVNVYSLDRSYVGEAGENRPNGYWVDEAEAALKYLSETRHQQVSLVGYSLGGLIASNVAAKQPEQLHRLCLTSPTTLPEEQLGAIVEQSKSAMPDIHAAVFDQFVDMGQGLAQKFQRIQVPTLFYFGADEVSEAPSVEERNFPKPFLEVLFQNISVPVSKKTFQLFPAEGHEVSGARLACVQRQWSSFS